MPSKLQKKKLELLPTILPEEEPLQRKAPFWARLLVRLVEVIVWALTLGYVKRITALERALGYAPQWHNRDKAEESIRDALRTGVGAAYRLAQPLLRIETELSQDIVRGASSPDVLTPRTATAYEETLKARLQVNARIRSYLHDVPLAELEAPFLVNACTWNVDQQPPPVREESFMTWLLGHELTEELKHYQQHKQSVMAHGGTVPKLFSPNATNTMRARKMSVAAGTGGNAGLARRESSSMSGSEKNENTDPLQTEWQWLEGKFPDLFLISLQEVEMTGTALVRESTQRRWEWTEAIIETLLAASDRTIEYKKVQVVQLVGLVLIVLVQAKHVDYVSHVRLSLTRTGALSVLGNKGSVAMRATIYGKRFLFISAHFAAHTYNEKKRTSNYHVALKDIRFDMPAWSDDESEVLQTFMNAARASDTAVENFSVAGSSALERLLRFRTAAFRPSFSSSAESRVLDEHDYVFFLGDLNSRLHALPGPEIRESVTQGEFDYLLCHDEVRQLMVSGEAFDGFQEQWISFPPTYKFDRNTDTYDTSRKHRDPAWCDRVLFRVLDSDAATGAEGEEGEEADKEVSDAGQESERDNGGSATSASASRRRSSKSYSSATSGGISLPREASVGGDWVSLEELQHSILSQLSAGGAGGAPADVQSRSSSTSSGNVNDVNDDSTASNRHSRNQNNSENTEDSDGQSLDTARYTAAMAAIAAQAGVALPTTASQHRRRGSPAGLSRSTLRTTWEPKRGAPTFCAVRRPREALPADNPFGVRFPRVTNHVNALEYTHVPTLRQSDHRPVRARFEVKVVAIEPAVVSEIVDSIQQVISD